jgi:maltose alpha-D-glucosyltransferase/alpha-amylase
MHTATREISPPGRPKSAEAALVLDREWAEAFEGRARAPLTAALQQWLPSRRWFRAKARTIDSISIREPIAVPMKGQQAFLALLDVNYAEGDPELYVLPLTAAFGRKAEAIARAWPRLVLARVWLNRPRKSGIVYDAIVNKDFCRALLELTARGQTVGGEAGEVEAEPTPVLRRLRRERGLKMEPSVGKAEQSNSSIIYKSALILKFFRRLDQGINPELEIERFLTARHFSHSPALAGALEYHDHHGRKSAMAVITSFIPDCHDAWEDTLQALNGFYERVRNLPAELRKAPPTAGTWRPVGNYSALPRTPADLVGAYLEDAIILGMRTAALHLALASDSTTPAFRPEPWTPGAQRSLFTAAQKMARDNFQLLRERRKTLPAEGRSLADKVLPLESLVNQRLRRITQQPMGASRIRTHGDYHLGQVLHHERDFLIIDFEGEPAISLKDRRAKQSALRDVAGMIYSFFYAANAALRERGNRLVPRRLETSAAWARYWSMWVGTTFLRAYLETARGASFIPADEAALKVMLDVELLRKAIYELGYELNNRPDWVSISFQVLLDLLNPENPI